MSKAYFKNLNFYAPTNLGSKLFYFSIKDLKSSSSDRKNLMWQIIITCVIYIYIYNVITCHQIKLMG